MRSPPDARLSPHSRAKPSLALLIGLFILLSGLYGVITPPFEAPDEIWHMAFVQHVASGKGLPVAEPNSQALWRQQGTQAPLYYVVAAGLTFWIDQSDFPDVYQRANPHAAIGRPDALANRNYLVHHSDENWPWRGSILALHLVRFFSALLGAVTLYGVYRTVALMFGDRPALLGAALVGFIPQFLFISASVSNDNVLNATAALMLWQLAALLHELDGRNSLSFRRLMVLGCLLGFALLSKLSAAALVAVAGAALLIVAARSRSWRVLLRGALGIGLPALLIAGWWFARNWLLYRDVLAWKVWEANILLRVIPAGWHTIANELGSLERSFWGLFGWLNVPYPDWIYVGFRAWMIFVGLGCLLALLHWLRGERHVDGRWTIGGLLLLWLALLTISWLRFMRVAPAAQGRYFFPALATFALLVLAGLKGWAAAVTWVCRLLRQPAVICGRSFKQAECATAGLLVTGLLALGVATPFWRIRPAYLPPPARAEMAAQLVPAHVEVGGRFIILGMSAQPTALRPGETAEIVVAWRALAPASIDYSVFVHLLSADDLVVAQADTMPGGGNRPTSQWLPGETRVETYRVTVPVTAYTPDRGRWSVGMYSHRTGERLAVAAAKAGPDLVVEGDSVVFGQAAVLASPGDVPNPVNVDFADNITLAGYSFSGRSLRPGDQLTVTLYWRARGPILRAYTSFAHLLDGHSQMQGGHDAAPQPSTQAWLPGQLTVDRHQFTVASDAAPGLYLVELGLYSWPELDRLALISAPGAQGADRLLLGPLKVAGQ